MKTGEMKEMSLMGVALTTKDKDTIYVEYHRCDKCGAEYRVYLKSPRDVEDTFQKLAKMMGNKLGEEDLCFNCQREIIADQSMFPLEI